MPVAQPPAQPARSQAPAAPAPRRQASAPARRYTLPSTGTGGAATHDGPSIAMLLAVLVGALGAAMAGSLRLRRVA